MTREFFFFKNYTENKARRIVSVHFLFFRKAFYKVKCRFWLASSEAIVLSLGNCKLPTVNKFHIT